jgi:HD-GYP domain-containing protein (c-di-GMP phosphodiesterase class II)
MGSGRYVTGSREGTLRHNREHAGDLYAEMAVHQSRESIKRAVAAARELLGVDIAWYFNEQPEDELGSRTTMRRAGGVLIPLRSSAGRLHGKLACRATNGELDERDVSFMRVLARMVADQLEAEAADLETRRQHVEAMGGRALLAAIEARDRYTGSHSKTVVELARRVGEELELSDRELMRVEQVAQLHDVGKVAVPDHILQKPGPLTEGEWEAIREHLVAGARIVRSIAGLAHLATAIRAAHERWDGTGYPDGLSGTDIPIASRISFVCDAFDAMTSDRPYRRSLGVRAAIRELERGSETQFCPEAVRALLRVLRRDDRRERSRVS